MFDESIKSHSAPNKILDCSLDYLGSKVKLKFNESCLKQGKITFTHGTLGKVYIVYEINQNYNISSYPTQENCYFSAVKLTKNINIYEYKYSAYGIGFDRKGKFSVDNGFACNVIIFGLAMSSSVHADTKKKDVLILGECPTQGLDGTT